MHPPLGSTSDARGPLGFSVEIERERTLLDIRDQICPVSDGGDEESPGLGEHVERVKQTGEPEPKPEPEPEP